MAGSIFSKERSIITLTTTGPAVANGSGTIANQTADLDLRNAGNGAGDFRAQFELLSQWVTITGILKDKVCYELYLIPKLDGTNLPDVDSTASTSSYPLPCQVATFTAVKQAVTNTDMRFVSQIVENLMPVLYAAHVINRSGQTNTVNWSLKVVPAQAQYS